MAQPEESDEALQARLESLSKRLDAEGKAERAVPGDKLDVPNVGSAMSLGFRVLTEFAAAVVVGTLIGWQIDVWCKTTPIFLIVFLVLGTAAGFWNVYRIAVRPTGPMAGRK